MSTTQNKVIEGILADFESEDDAIILDALKRVKSKGNASVIKPMVAVYSTSESDEVRGEIRSLLAQIKVKNALIEMVESLAEGDDDVNEMLLFSIWNANLNASEYLAEIVDASCRGDYMVALEGLTVIENMDGPFSEEVLTDARLVLNEYFNNEEDEKVDLMKSILGIINNFEESY